MTDAELKAMAERVIECVDAMRECDRTADEDAVRAVCVEVLRRLQPPAETKPHPLAWEVG